jgi:hypothetical protein
VFTVAYTVGYVEVYVNGVLLNASDYTASNGTSVTLATTAVSGDVVEFIAFTTGSVIQLPINLASQVTGVLPIANGGTNASTASITSFNNITGYTASGATGTTSTNLVFSTSPTLVTPILGTPQSGTLTSCTGLPLTTGVTGTLPIANGGTGNTSGAATAITNSGGWSVTPSGTKLYFNYNGTNVASLDSSGNLITLGTVSAGGTP